jgi:hypothetical protein
MKTKLFSLTRMALAGVFSCALALTGCMTTYDRDGRPVQSVDPGLAVAGVAAAGLLGYAAANNRNDNDYYYRGDRYRGGYYGGRYYYRGRVHDRHPNYYRR